MITAMEVGAVFRIVNEASPVLERLAQQFKELQVQIDAVKNALANFGRSGAMKTLQTQIGEIDKGLGTIGTRAEESFGKMNVSIDRTMIKMRELMGEMEGMRMGSGLGSGRPRIGGGGGGGRKGGFSGRGPRIAGLGGTDMEAHGDGLMAIIGGLVGGDIIKHILESGGELETEKQLLRSKLGINGTEADITGAQAYAQSYTTGSQGIIGTTVSGNMKGIRELTSITPDLATAEKIFPTFMKAAKVLEELTGEKGDKTMPLLGKALENLGGGINPTTHELDPARMQMAVGEAIKTIVAGGGYIDANALLGFSKQAGIMGRLSDPGKTFDTVITALLDMGGFRAGTAYTALGREFVSDKMTSPVAEELEKIGILPHGSWKKAGGGISMNPGFDGVKGIDIIKDPAGGMGDWFGQIMQPAIAQYLKDKNHRDPTNADIMEESGKVFGVSTAQRLGALFLANEAQRARDVAIRHGVDPNATYQGLTDKDYAMNAQNMSAALKNLAETFGSASIPAAISSMKAMSDMMNTMAGFAGNHPGGANLATEIAAVSSGLLVLGGSIRMVRYMLGGFAGISSIVGSPVTAGVAGAAGLVGLFSWLFQGHGTSSAEADSILKRPGIESPSTKFGPATGGKFGAGPIGIQPLNGPSGMGASSNVNANISISVKAETADANGLAAQLAGPLLKILKGLLGTANLNNQGSAGGSSHAPAATGAWDR